MHTPGPWEVERIEIFGRHDREGTADIVLWDEDQEGYEVVVPAVDYDDEKSKANAHLIAAAPELFEHLTEAAAQFRKYEDLHRAKGTPDSLAKAEVNAELAERFEATLRRAGGVF